MCSHDNMATVITPAALPKLSRSLSRLMGNALLAANCSSKFAAKCIVQA